MEPHGQLTTAASIPTSDKGRLMNPYAIHMATILDKRREAEDIDTYRLELADHDLRRAYRFSAGQFNMLYVFGVGEVPISIVSDPDEPEHLDHTIRVAGRVTNAIARLQVGDSLGIRGPFGRGWPLEAIRGKENVRKMIASIFAPAKKVEFTYVTQYVNHATMEPMSSIARYTPDKLEGLAVAADGEVYMVTDNDGLDSALGQTLFLGLGPVGSALAG